VVELERQISEPQESTNGRDLSDLEFQKILQTYEQSLILPSDKPTQQYIILPVGLVGSGKTTVLKGLEKKLPFIRLRTDDVRKLLMAGGFNLIRTAELVIILVKKYLDLGYSLAIDGDCAGATAQVFVDKVPPAIRKIWIHIVASEKTILDRLENPRPDRWYSGPKAVENYLARKMLHQNLTMPFSYTFDTDQNNFDDQIQELVKIILTDTTL
jgi:hypothetical protein